MAGAAIKVLGLVLGPQGIYLVLLVDIAFPVGWTFQLDWRGRRVCGEVDYCHPQSGKFLVGVEVRRALGSAPSPS